MYCHLKKTAFEMLSRTQAYSRIRGLITKTLTRRACSSGDVIGRNPIGVLVVRGLGFLPDQTWEGICTASRKALEHGDGLLSTRVLVLKPFSPNPSIGKVSMHKSLYVSCVADGENEYWANFIRVSALYLVKSIAVIHVKSVSNLHIAVRVEKEINESPVWLRALYRLSLNELNKGRIVQAARLLVGSRTAGVLAHSRAAFLLSIANFNTNYGARTFLRHLKTAVPMTVCSS